MLSEFLQKVSLFSYDRKRRLDLINPIFSSCYNFMLIIDHPYILIVIPYFRLMH